jgi:prevent-host-death family protein
MISVGVKELKAKLSNFLDKARSGEEVIITEHGKDVALLLPISKERKAVKSLIKSGGAKWAGGKPKGIQGVKVKGEPISDTVLEDRR